MCKMRETEAQKVHPPSLRASVASSGTLQERRGQGESLVRAPSHPGNLGFSFAALALEASGPSLGGNARHCTSQPCRPRSVLPSRSGRTVASGPLLEEALALGTPGAGVTCRSCRGSPSAAGRAEPGSPWSIPDTWGRPHVPPPALFFTEGRFWRKSRGRGETVKTLHSGLARRLCEVKVPFRGHLHVPHQTDGQTDRQTDPRGLGWG